MIIKGLKKYLIRIQEADKLRLFLDYDGTLAEFAPTPDDIFPDPVLIDLLTQLCDDSRFHLSIISGRRLGHIRKLIPISGILLAGTYGIEMVTPSGDQINRVDFQQIRPLLDEIKPLWSELIQPYDNFYLEDKRWSLALHARDVEETLAGKILDQAKRSIPESLQAQREFRILGGDKFLEIAPRLANKELTIEYLVKNQPLNGALPVYIGDDDKDEEAFETILNCQGIAIKVCAQPCQTKAQLTVNNPDSVRQILSSLL